jgi:hypothetical protein
MCKFNLLLARLWLFSCSRCPTPSQASTQRSFFALLFVYPDARPSRFRRSLPTSAPTFVLPPEPVAPSVTPHRLRPSLLARILHLRLLRCFAEPTQPDKQNDPMFPTRPRRAHVIELSSTPRYALRALVVPIFKGFFIPSFPSCLSFVSLCLFNVGNIIPGVFPLSRPNHKKFEFN